jgi:hypothetical protein
VLAVIMIAVALSGCSVRGTLAGSNHEVPTATPTPISTTTTPSPGGTTAAGGSGASDPLTGVTSDLGSLDGITNQIDQDLGDGNAAAGKSDNG